MTMLSLSYAIQHKPASRIFFSWTEKICQMQVSRSYDNKILKEPCNIFTVNHWTDFSKEVYCLAKQLPQKFLAPTKYTWSYGDSLHALSTSFLSCQWACWKLRSGRWQGIGKKLCSFVSTCHDLEPFLSFSFFFWMCGLLSLWSRAHSASTLHGLPRQPK